MKFWQLSLAGCVAVLGVMAMPVRTSRAAEPRDVHKTAHKTAPFFLKDGDRVVFYGDSITEQKLYTTYIETYCVTRFPKKNFTFVHSGWGGDRVTGGGGGPIDLRLKRDILAYKPTVVTICLGMNDAGYRAFDQNIYNTYVNGYRHIIETLQKELPGVRLTLLTASAYDDVTKTAGFPGGYNSTLTTYGEAVKELGQEYNIPVADTNAPLVAVLNRAESADAKLAGRILPDRVHPGPGGHLVMATAVLKVWNAPSTVADIEIDAKSGQLTQQENSRVSNLKVSGNTLSFTHLDGALPWPFDRRPDNNPDANLTLMVSDIEQAYNRYVLKVTGLTGNRYQLSVDGKALGVVAGSDLQNGVDLASLPGLPANEQANLVLGLTRKHNDLHSRRWRNIQLAAKRNGLDDVPADVRAQMDALDAQEVDAVKEQRMMAQPKPHRVELTPAQ
jgi:lysophospholipase L1-like esterase